MSAVSLHTSPGGSGRAKTPALVPSTLPMAAALAPERPAGWELPRPPPQGLQRKVGGGAASHPAQGLAAALPLGKRWLEEKAPAAALEGERGERGRPQGRGGRWADDDAEVMTQE